MNDTPAVWPPWQPIATAPRDVPILVAAKDLVGKMTVFCASNYRGVNAYGNPYSGWSVLGCGCQEGGTDFDEPTHWLPLPPPPPPQSKP